MSDWKWEEITNKYKWANGFTEAKMNKVQIVLGIGTQFGIAWIIMGGGLPAVGLVYLISYLAGWNPNLTNVVAWCGAYFGVGLMLELYCGVCRDKVAYNQEIASQAQMNLFRDFGVSLK